MLKRFLSVAMASLILLVGVTSCNTEGGSGDDNQQSDNSLEGGLKTIDDLDTKKTFVITIAGATLEDGINATTGLEAEGYNTLAKNQLKEKFPSIDVEFVGIPWDNVSARMQTALMSKETDLFTQGGAFQPEYFKEDLSQSLNKFLDADSNFTYTDWFPANFMTHQNCTSYDGEHLLTLPWDVGYRLIMYDAQIFEDWNVEPLSEKPTPEEVLEKAAKMTGVNPVTGKQNYGMYIGANSLNMSYLIPLQEYYGAKEAEGSWDDQGNLKWFMDTEEYASAVQWLVDAAKFVPEAATTGAGSENWGTEDNDIAIMIDGNGGKMTSAIVQDESKKEELTERFVPTMHFGNNGGNWTPVDGMGIAAHLTGDDAEMAWHLLKFMTTEAAQWREDQHGPSFSGNIKVQESYPDWDIWRQMNARVSAEATHPGFEINPFFQASIQPVLASMISRSIAGEEIDVEEELDDLQKKAVSWSESRK